MHVYRIKVVIEIHDGQRWKKHSDYTRGPTEKIQQLGGLFNRLKQQLDELWPIQNRNPKSQGS